MDINDILKNMGLDLSNPETKRGALEAIDAILASRANASNGSAGIGGPGGESNINIDPDLIQPSIKQASYNDSDVEIEDEEHILDQVKVNDAEEPPAGYNQVSTDANETSDSETGTNTGEQAQDGTAGVDTEADEQEEQSDAVSEPDKDTLNDSSELENTDQAIDINDSDDTEAAADSLSDKVDIDNDDNTEDEPAEDDSEAQDEEAFNFDPDELLDDELKNSTENKDLRTKTDTRKIKRERTITAAKKALADAQVKKVHPSLIKELENAIAALEALTEAISKSIKEISDTEFNQLVNRVFDAIQACGDSGLTFTSEAEREAQVKEINDDLADTKTQMELSAEDIAKIRSEVQAVKARDKETAKYKPRARSSFKGFKEFLNSLYRAIALQVHTEETRDDSWSAINHRHSGTNVLQPGKKVQELANKKIPVIDFYFDQSGSWTDADIKVGEKAVQSLAEMEANGQIKINVYYFANDVFTDAASARAQGGTAAWNEIVKNIIATQATNVVIMTDKDMENWWDGPSPLAYTVPGYVWYLWKDGVNAPRLPRDLKGRGGVQQFSFSSNDV